MARSPKHPRGTRGPQLPCWTMQVRALLLPPKCGCQGSFSTSGCPPPPIPEPLPRTPGIHHRPRLLPQPGHAPSAGSIPTAEAQGPAGNPEPQPAQWPCRGPTPTARAAHSQCICEVSPPCAASCAPPACTGL